MNSEMNGLKEYPTNLSSPLQGGFYLFNLTDAFLSGYPLLFVGMFELIALQWVYSECPHKQNRIGSLNRSALAANVHTNVQIRK